MNSIRHRLKLSCDTSLLFISQIHSAPGLLNDIFSLFKNVMRDFSIW